MRPAMRLAWPLLLLLLIGCRPALPGPRPPKSDARPSDIVAADLNFARAARIEGQWTAYRDWMADGAILFVPRLVGAETWLDTQADPERAIDWQPHHIYVTCDSSLAASVGAWQGDEQSHGAYLTIWQRQLDGSYRWILDYDWPRDIRLGEPDFIQTDVIGCPNGKLFGTVTVPGSAQQPDKGYEQGAIINGAQLRLIDASTLNVAIWVDGQEAGNLSFVGNPGLRGEQPPAKVTVTSENDEADD